MIKLNGTQVGNVYFNGTKLDNVYFNGTKVFSGYTPVSQTRTLDLMNSGHCYGRDPAQDPVTRKTLTSIGTFSGDVMESSASKFQYTLTMPEYWRNTSVTLTDLYAVLTAGEKTLTLPTMSLSYTGRGVVQYAQSLITDVWLGDESSIKLSVYYNSSASGNYLYTWYYNSSSTENRYVTLEMASVE